MRSSSARSVNDGHEPFDSRRTAPRAPTSTATTLDQEVAVDRRRLELDVVDADDLAAVDVDDLLVEQIALEQQQAVGGREALPVRGLGCRADGRAGRGDGVGREHALAAGGLDDQERDAGRMVLRRDRDLAHPSADGAGGVAHGGAEQFGQSDD